MDDETLRELYDGFAEIMRANGMDWVVAQVEAQLSDLPVRRASEIGNGMPLGEYTPEERFLTLLRAAEFVVYDVTQMEAEINDFFVGRQLQPLPFPQPEIIRRPTEIALASDDEFVDDAEVIDSAQDEFRAYEISLEDLQDQISQQVTAATQFRDLIQRIRDEVSND